MTAQTTRRRVSCRHLLIPKGHWVGKAKRITDRPETYDDRGLSWLAGQLGPLERKAMRAIVTEADVFEVGGVHYLVAAVSHETIAALACFEAESEDRELQGEGDPYGDNAFDHVNGRWVDGDTEPTMGWADHPNQEAIAREQTHLPDECEEDNDYGDRHEDMEADAQGFSNPDPWVGGPKANRPDPMAGAPA